MSINQSPLATQTIPDLWIIVADLPAVAPQNQVAVFRVAATGLERYYNYDEDATARTVAEKGEIAKYLNGAWQRQRITIGDATGGITAGTIVTLLTGLTGNARLSYDSLKDTPTNTQLSTEEVQDIVGALVSGGTGITVDYSDTDNTLTITLAIPDDSVGLGKLVTPAADSSESKKYVLQVATDGVISWVEESESGSTLTDEQLQDKVAAFIQAGINVTATYNDAANTLTISFASPTLVGTTADVPASPKTGDRIRTTTDQVSIAVAFSKKTVTGITSTDRNNFVANGVHLDEDGNLSIDLSDISTASLWVQSLRAGDTIFLDGATDVSFLLSATPRIVPTNSIINVLYLPSTSFTQTGTLTAIAYTAFAVKAAAVQPVRSIYEYRDGYWWVEVPGLFEPVSVSETSDIPNDPIENSKIRINSTHVGLAPAIQKIEGITGKTGDVSVFAAGFVQYIGDDLYLSVSSAAVAQEFIDSISSGDTVLFKGTQQFSVVLSAKPTVVTINSISNTIKFTDGEFSPTGFLSEIAYTGYAVKANGIQRLLTEFSYQDGYWWEEEQGIPHPLPPNYGFLEDDLIYYENDTLGIADTVDDIPGKRISLINLHASKHSAADMLLVISEHRTELIRGLDLMNGKEIWGVLGSSYATGYAFRVHSKSTTGVSTGLLGYSLIFDQFYEAHKEIRSWTKSDATAIAMTINFPDPEEVQDIVSAFLEAGEGITLAEMDADNTLKISLTHPERAHSSYFVTKDANKGWELVDATIKAGLSAEPNGLIEPTITTGTDTITQIVVHETGLQSLGTFTDYKDFLASVGAGDRITFQNWRSENTDGTDLGTPIAVSWKIESVSYTSPYYTFSLSDQRWLTSIPSNLTLRDSYMVTTPSTAAHVYLDLGITRVNQNWFKGTDAALTYSQATEPMVDDGEKWHLTADASVEYRLADVGSLTAETDTLEASLGADEIQISSTHVNNDYTYYFQLSASKIAQGVRLGIGDKIRLESDDGDVTLTLVTDPVSATRNSLAVLSARASVTGTFTDARVYGVNFLKTETLKARTVLIQVDSEWEIYYRSPVSDGDWTPTFAATGFSASSISGTYLQAKNGVEFSASLVVAKDSGDWLNATFTLTQPVGTKISRVHGTVTGYGGADVRYTRGFNRNEVISGQLGSSIYAAAVTSDNYLYFFRHSSKRVYRVNLDTDTHIPVVLNEVGGSYNSVDTSILAATAIGTQIYGIGDQHQALYTFDATNGLVKVGVLTNFGLGATTVAFRGLAYRESDGMLYAVDSTGTDLYKLSPTTGAATKVGDIDTSAGTPEGFAIFDDIGYVWSDASDDFHRVNLDNGNTIGQSDLGGVNVRSYALASDAMNLYAIDPNGRIWRFPASIEKIDFAGSNYTTCLGHCDENSDLIQVRVEKLGSADDEDVIVNLSGSYKIDS